MSTHTQLLASPAVRPMTPSHRRLLRAGTAVTAALVAAIVWTIAVQFVGIHLDVVSFGQAQSVSLASAMIGGLLPGLMGWALLAILERFTRSARLIWTITALVVLVVSLASPLLALAAMSTTVTLLCLHLVVGLALIIGLRRSTS